MNDLLEKQLRELKRVIRNHVCSEYDPDAPCSADFSPIQPVCELKQLLERLNDLRF